MSAMVRLGGIDECERMGTHLERLGGPRQARDGADDILAGFQQVWALDDNLEGDLASLSAGVG